MYIVPESCTYCTRTGNPLPRPNCTLIVRCQLSPTRCIRTVVFAKRLAQPDFSSCILFYDEASFTLDCVLSLQNIHVWAQGNPTCTRALRSEQRFTINVWAAVIGGILTVLYQLQQRTDGQIYHTSLERVLSHVSLEAPGATRLSFWFQHDGAPTNCTRIVRE